MLHLTPGFLNCRAQSHFGGLLDKLNPRGQGQNKMFNIVRGILLSSGLSTDRCSLMDSCDVLTEYVKFAHILSNTCMACCSPNSPELPGAITVHTSAGDAYPYSPTNIARTWNVSPLNRKKHVCSNRNSVFIHTAVVDCNVQNFSYWML